MVNRFGGAVAAVLLLIGPVIAVMLIMAFWQAVRKVKSLSKNWAWWHLLWLILALSACTFRIRDINAIHEEAVDSAAFLRIALVGLTAFVLIASTALSGSAWPRSLFRGSLGPLTGFSLVCLASTVWSVFPLWTLYKSFEYLADVATLAFILAMVRSAHAYKAFLDWTWVLCGVLAGSTWLGMLLWPSEALVRGYDTGVLGFRLRGVFPSQSSNDVGDLGAILALVALSRLLSACPGKSSRAWYGLVLVFGVSTAILSQTRTALAALAIGMLLVLFLTKRRAIAAFLALTVIPLFAFSSAWGLLQEFFLRGEEQTQFYGLNSRAHWWDLAWQVLLQHPLTGLGAWAGGRFGVIATYVGDQGPSTLHSDYLETLAGTSFWGLLLLVAAVVSTLYLLVRALKSYPATSLEFRLALESITVLSLLTLRSTFNTIFTWHFPLHFFAVLGCAEFLRRCQAIGSRVARDERCWPEPQGWAFHPRRPA
jgi:O-antigen ligase